VTGLGVKQKLRRMLGKAGVGGWVLWREARMERESWSIVLGGG